MLNQMQTMLSCLSNLTMQYNLQFHVLCVFSFFNAIKYAKCSKCYTSFGSNKNNISQGLCNVYFVSTGICTKIMFRFLTILLFNEFFKVMNVSQRLLKQIIPNEN